MAFGNQTSGMCGCAGARRCLRDILNDLPKTAPLRETLKVLRRRLVSAGQTIC